MIKKCSTCRFIISSKSKTYCHQRHIQQQETKYLNKGQVNSAKQHGYEQMHLVCMATWQVESIMLHSFQLTNDMIVSISKSNKPFGPRGQTQSLQTYT